MDEWGDLDARLERKKRIKLRRQQRELKKQQIEMELLEKERLKLVLRCEEMAREDALSVTMMRFYRYQERLQRREVQREKDMQVYEQTAEIRRRAKKLGLPLETPGFVGEARFAELKIHVETREAAMESAARAKQRLDALPKKRSRVRSLLQSYFTTSLHSKVDRALVELRVEALVELLDPKVPGNKAVTPSLLNHECSDNGLTPVLCAIFQHKRVALRRLLELGASPDFESKAGVTPLLASIMVDDVVALHILVEFRADLKFETQTGVLPLLLAAEKGRNALLKAMLRLGVDVNQANATLGRTALMQAVLAGSYDTVKVLLAFGADQDKRDTNNQSALDYARRWKFNHIAALLTSSVSRESLMAQVQEQEELEADAPSRLVQQVVKSHSLSPGAVAMEKALRDRDIARILELLSLENVGFGPNYETPGGEMPLLVVSERGSAKQVLACIEHKCCVLQTNRLGMNALMKAAYRADSTVMEVLIQAGCSLHSRDFQGKDSFRHLNDHNHPDIVEMLTKTHGTQPAPRLGLSEPQQNLTSLRSLIKTAKFSSVLSPSSTKEESSEADSDADRDTDDDDSSTHERNESSLADGSRDEEEAKRYQWSLRRRVLHADAKRNKTFEGERMKVWKYAQRGRRHGLIAPIPHDPSGRLKFPSCDNCQSGRARKRCFLCEQVLCDKCHARLHELPHRRHHEYEELAPTLMVGTKPKAEVDANQVESLQGSIQRSLSCVNAIKQTLHLPVTPETTPHDDIEVEKYERKQRAIREKEIAQMQINVPVAAAKHAVRNGDGDIYNNPAEIELADLYIAQGKLTKAKVLMETTRQVIEESLGYAHPTMLKIHIRVARIQLHSEDLGSSLDTIQAALGTFESSLSPDQKDLVVAQDLALQLVDTLARYDSAVELCKRILRLRVIGLPSSHSLIRQAHARLDEYIAKRETTLISKEDTRVLEHAARSEEYAENQRLERKRHLQSFRTLLLEETPPELFDAFIMFARKEFAEDTVHFWIAIEKAKTTIDEHDAKAFRANVVTIFLMYIKSRRIKSITAVQRKKMKKLITTPGKKVPRSIFDEVQAIVWDVLYNRVYARFETTQTTEKSSC